MWIVLYGFINKTISLCSHKLNWNLITFITNICGLSLYAIVKMTFYRYFSLRKRYGLKIAGPNVVKSKSRTNSSLIRVRHQHHPRPHPRRWPLHRVITPFFLLTNPFVLIKTLQYNILFSIFVGLGKIRTVPMTKIAKKTPITTSCSTNRYPK